MSSNNLTVRDPVKSYTSRRSTSSLSASLSSSALSSKSQPSTFVIEIGNRLTRFGIAGEQAPRQVFRTEFTDISHPTRSIPLYDPTREPNEQERILTSFFKEITLGKMLKNPMNSRFIIVDNLFSTSEFRNLFARVLFKNKTLEVASISFVPAPLMHMVTMNAKTALLIDTGINECLLYPVFDRVVLFQQFDATPCSTAAVERKIKELMKLHGRVQTIDGSERELNEADWKLFDKLRCTEDICYRFCFATTRERIFEMQDNQDFKFAPSVKLSFGTEFLVVPGIVRETAVEVVFAYDQDSRSIPQIIIEFIDRASIEVKKQYLGSLLFVGGLSHMKGFLSRIREELEFLLGVDRKSVV